jgi:hypothetical protein
MRQVQAELTIIGEENQSFAIIIKPPDRVKVAPFPGEQLIDGRTVELVLPGANQAPGLVEGEIQFSLGADGLPIDSDAVMNRVNAGAEFLNGPSIDGDPPGKDKLLACAAGGHACFREKFLQTNQSSVFFGLAQAGDAVALFPLASLLEHLDALEALEDISFAAQSGSGAQTTML